MKKLLKIALAVVVPVVFAMPGVASAHAVPPDTATVAVFTGDASVAPGLCIPGDQTVVAPNCVGPTTATYNLTIPGPAGTVPKICFAAGLLENDVADPNPILAGNNNCGLVANGTVSGTVAPLKPSCGLSHGASVGTNTVTVKTLLGGTVTRNATSGWLTSAGGTIPVLGNVDDQDADTTADADDHALVALVQARPITPAGTIACVTAPAQDFIVAGVALVV